jgi:hypothetical protein
MCVIITTQNEETNRLCAYFKENHVDIIPVTFSNAMTFMPLDGHPNSFGHRHFAALVYAALNNFGWIKKAS